MYNYSFAEITVPQNQWSKMNLHLLLLLLFFRLIAF